MSLPDVDIETRTGTRKTARRRPAVATQSYAGFLSRFTIYPGQPIDSQIRRKASRTLGTRWSTTKSSL